MTVTLREPALLALFPRASDTVREGFARVINHDGEAGEVSIEAVDDTGARLGPVTLFIEAGETAHFNSGDLEDGNAAKGLPVGVGSGEGGLAAGSEFRARLRGALLHSYPGRLSDRDARHRAGSGRRL